MSEHAISETIRRNVERAQRGVAPGASEPSERERAVAAARVLLRAPNIDQDSDVVLLARQFLRVLGLPERV